MSDTLSPTSADDVRAAVREAQAQEQPLEVVGGGTKRAWGRPVKSNRILDLSGLRGVTLYEPEELVLSAKAGTRMAEIEALLAQHKQMLAFEPMDMTHLFSLSPWGEGAPTQSVGRGEGNAGRSADRTAPSPHRPVGPAPVTPPTLRVGGRGDTLGGVVACNLSGPRRIKAGAARDHFLGFHAVSGRGEAFKAGGRVMKNVTGYDLPKLLCGSFGTLAVMTEITVKVLPAPEKARTVLILGLDDTQARDAMAAALNSPHDASGAAHLPRAVAARSGVGYVRGAGHAVTAIRVEGFGPSVEARCKSLRDLLAGFGPVEELHTMNSAKLWGEIRDVVLLLPDASLDLWRLSLPPAAGAGVIASLAFGDGIETSGHFYDWGGGLVWLALPPTTPVETATAIRAAMAPAGGHATLIRASEETRETIAAFHPEPPALAAIVERLKEAFDPAGILNPGRLVAPAAGAPGRASEPGRAST